MSLDLCQSPKPTVKRGALVIELTTNALCDLNCTYCFEGAKTDKRRLEDIDLLMKRIDEVLASSWFEENYTDCQITFWGGEPTLNTGYIIQIMDRYSKDDRINFHMYTNGFNIKNMTRIVNNVDYSKLSIQISYDGDWINDIFRLTNAGTSSKKQVLNTLQYLADKGINVSLKSTLPTTAMKNLVKTWLSFEKLYYHYKEYKNVHISFAPTIDYSMNRVDQDAGGNVDLFREQILLIAKKEIEFALTEDRHLMSWFNGSDRKSNCSAGLNFIAVDVDGQSYACHGALYADDKEALRSSTIYDDDFINKVSTFNDSFEQSLTRVPEVCKTCVATTCIVCPVQTFEVSKKETFEEKWEDRGVNGLCKYYQAFGEIDRSVQKYLQSKRRK